MEAKPAAPGIGVGLRQAAGQACLILGLATFLALGVNALRPHGIPLVGDWTPEDRLVLPSGENMVISLDEAAELFCKGGAVFLDARAADAYAEGHIAGALSLPWQEFAVHFDEVMPFLSEDVTIITYCDGKTCDLSEKLAMELFYMGFGRPRVLVNGWTRWVEAALPTG